MIVTLPMPWWRYLMVVIPALALIGGVGTAKAVSAFIEGIPRRLRDAE